MKCALISNAYKIYFFSKLTLNFFGFAHFHSSIIINFISLFHASSEIFFSLSRDALKNNYILCLYVALSRLYSRCMPVDYRQRASSGTWNFFVVFCILSIPFQQWDALTGSLMKQQWLIIEEKRRNKIAITVEGFFCSWQIGNAIDILLYGSL